jgi:uncharacterized protein YkwD
VTIRWDEAMNALEQRVFDVTNLQRRRSRLNPLSPDAALADVARRHSQDMLRRRFFAHTNPDGQTPADRTASAVGRRARASGENIWIRTGPVRSGELPGVMDEAFAQLVASPSHRGNILNGRFTHLGVGVAMTASEIRLTQLFARFEKN